MGGDREEHGRQDEVGHGQECPDGAEEQERDLGGRAVDKVIAIPGICGFARLVDIIIVARCREGGGEEGNISTEGQGSEHDDGEDALDDAHREEEYLECCHGDSRVQKWIVSCCIGVLCSGDLGRLGKKSGRFRGGVGLGGSTKREKYPSQGRYCMRQIYDDSRVIHCRQKGRAKMGCTRTSVRELRVRRVCFVWFALFSLGFMCCGKSGLFQPWRQLRHCASLYNKPSCRRGDG